MRLSRRWMTCDDHKSPCLFDEHTVHTRLRSNPPRCIRHGALLFSNTTMDGMTRAQARKKLDRESGQ